MGYSVMERGLLLTESSALANPIEVIRHFLSGKALIRVEKPAWPIQKVKTLALSKRRFSKTFLLSDRRPIYSSCLLKQHSRSCITCHFPLKERVMMSSLVAVLDFLEELR